MCEEQCNDCSCDTQSEDIETIEEVELWKFRALVSEKRALSAEMTIIKMKFEDIEGELECFKQFIDKKYNNIPYDSDGNLLRNEE